MLLVVNLEAELRIVIEDEMLIPMFVWKGVTQLLRHPTACGMFGNTKVQNAPTVMANDEEAIEQPKRDVWYGEKIHGCEGLAMILKKRPPTFSVFRIAGRFLHPSGYGSLRDIESQLEQFP